MVCQGSCAEVLPKFTGQEHTHEVLKSIPLLPLQTSKKKICSQKDSKSSASFWRKKAQGIVYEEYILGPQKPHLPCDF